MLITKIKQNLAGFAAVVIAAVGFTALAPANASVSAIADTANTSFRVYKSMSFTGNVGTATVGDATNLGRGMISTTWNVDQATANSLIGHTLSATLTVTGPGGSYDMAANGFFQQFIVYHSSTAVVQQGQISSNPSVVWPTGTNSNNTSVLASFYVNSATFSFPTGNYSVTAVLKDNGTPVTLGSGITINSGYFEYKVPGNALTSVESGTSWDSGFVCVDMSQVSANDVLTVDKTENGSVIGNQFGDWYNTGSTVTSVASGASRTVTSTDIANGALAFRTQSAGVSASVGQAVTLGLNIKKADGTDVSISCGPTTAPAAPTAASGGMSISVTPASSIPAGYGLKCALLNSSNVIVSTQTSSTSPCSLAASASGTYTAKLAYTRYGVAGAYSAASNSVSYTYTPPLGPCNAVITSLTPTVTDLTPSSAGYTLYANGNSSLTNCFGNSVSGFGSRATLNGTVVGSASYSAMGSPVASSSPRTLAALLLNPNISALNPTDGAVYTVSYYSGLSAAPTANDVPAFSYSVTLYPTGNIPGNNQQQNNNQQVQQVTPPTIPTNVPIVAPISVPATGLTPGGALLLDGRNLSNLTQVKIGEAIAKTVASATGVSISVPTDLKPGSHDLLISTSTGSTLFVGAIKVADPVVEAAKAAQAKAAASIAYRAPVDFTVGKAVTASQAAAAKSFAAQYRNAKTAVCIAIPASKATAAAALAAATKVCAGFKASVPGIKTSVAVTAPSGDKVNRVSAEIQG